MKRYAIAVVFLLWICEFSCPALASALSDPNRDVDDRSKESRPDTLVVCPAEFQPALKRWLEYRAGQGHKIKVITPAANAAAMTQQIRRVAAQADLKFVFLVGDVASKRNIAARPVPVENPPVMLATSGNDVTNKPPAVPSAEAPLAIASKIPAIPMHYIPAQVNVQYGSEPEISSDHPYSDLNGDGLPDVALGRLPAKSVEEVRHYLDRIIAYEAPRSGDDSWRRRIHFVAGVGGFGTVIDSVLEQFTKEAVSSLIPPEYQTAMTLASWQSPFCPDPRRFSQKVVERFNQGCLFWIYIGHGRPTELDRLRLPDQLFPILNPASINQIHCPEGNPIAIFLACYTGAIDHHQDCLTKVLLRQPQGPIAIVSGTRVTMPYAMSSMMLELAEDYFNSPIDTLGELVRSAKYKMVVNNREANARAVSPSAQANSSTQNEYERLRCMVQGTGRALSPTPELLNAECEEHLHLMHLYGDPLLKLEKPQRIEIQTEVRAKAGSQLTIRGNTPLAGRLCIDLAYPRDRFRQRPQFRKRYEPSDEAFRQYEVSYEAANNLICDSCVNVVDTGSFEAILNIPADVSGDCIVRCILSSPDGYALGSTKLFVEK